VCRHTSRVADGLSKETRLASPGAVLFLLLLSVDHGDAATASFFEALSRSERTRHG
jgi:hypothetical protein